MRSDLGLQPDFNELGRQQGTQSVVACDSGDSIQAIGLFGTAGSPEDIEKHGDWRQDFVNDVEELKMSGIPAEAFNPVVPDWTPECAEIEARHLAQDAVLVLPVLDTTDGYGTLAETGFGARRAARGQDVYQYIEPAKDESDEARVRSRHLISSLGESVISLYPELAGCTTNSIQNMRVIAINRLKNRVQQAESPRIVEKRTEFIVQETPLEPTIAIVGSGAQEYEGSWYADLKGKVVLHGVEESEVYTSYKDDWDFDDAAVELEHKINDAVVLVAVTSDQTSYGATAEIGWLTALAERTGQSLGIYVEQHHSNNKSDANRQRKLTITHLSQAMSEKRLPVYVAPTVEKLALFGAAQYFKAKQ